jgi:hypothetical protein
MKVKAEIVKTSAGLMMSAEGLLLKLPCSDFRDPNNPGAAFARLLKRRMTVCEVSKPLLLDDLQEPTLHKILFSAGHLTNTKLLVVDGSVEFYGKITPGGFNNEPVRMFIQENGYLDVTPKIVYYNDKISLIPTFLLDVSKPSEKH